MGTTRALRTAIAGTALLAAAGLACAAALAAPAGRATGATELRLVYLPDGARPKQRVVSTLACDPPRGTLRRRAAACAALARSGAETLLPVPPDTACAELYGGPQVLLVVGTIDGRRVWARLRRDDGCQIARWERNRLLVPV